MNEAIRRAIEESRVEFARTGKLYSVDEAKAIVKRQRAGDHDAHVMRWETAVAEEQSGRGGG